MKKLFLPLLAILSLHSAAQNQYYVTVIKGNIFRQNNSIVHLGDKVSSNETLVFTAKDDFLIVLNTKGRYTISAASKKNVKSSELIKFLIKDKIRLHAENIRLSSRAIGDEIDLANYFKSMGFRGKDINKKILVADELKIPIENMGYVNLDNKEQFFFLQLIDTSGNGINKKLFVRDDTLFLSREDFIFNGKLYTSGDGILKLGFVEEYSGEKKIKEIADINPVFISKEELRQLVWAIRISLPNSPRNDVINEIYTQLYFFYGKPDRQLIENLYDNQK